MGPKLLYIFLLTSFLFFSSCYPRRELEDFEWDWKHIPIKADVYTSGTDTLFFTSDSTVKVSYIVKNDKQLQQQENKPKKSRISIKGQYLVKHDTLIIGFTFDSKRNFVGANTYRIDKNSLFLLRKNSSFVYRKPSNEPNEYKLVLRGK
jgi:hypothetical protein